MSSIASSLAQAAAIQDHAQRGQAYYAVLGQVFALRGGNEFSTGVDACARHLSAEETPLVLARPVLQHMATVLFPVEAQEHSNSSAAAASGAAGGAGAAAAAAAAQGLSNEERAAAAEKALETLEARRVAFEDSISVLRLGLAKILQGQSMWREAAAVLQKVPLDSGQRQLGAVFKMKIYVNIAQLYLQDKDSVEAEMHMNRAADLLYDVRDAQRKATDKAEKDVKVLLLKYNVCFAKILDFKRDFLKAALRYNELSQVAIISDAERRKSLAKAVTCAVLSPAGPQKSRLMATLYKDERTQQLETYPVLEAMFLERILRQPIVDAFQAKLKDHQRALLADGSTVVQRAVMEHNLSAASNLYHNVTFPELGLLLGVDAKKAEKTAIRMVQEKRLVASIDQVRQLIKFEHDTSSLQSWDNRIVQACNALNDIMDIAQQKYPGLVE